jgi:hypothetical protein
VVHTIDGTAVSEGYKPQPLSATGESSDAEGTRDDETSVPAME